MLLIKGLIALLTLKTILYIAIATVAGLAIGALPGLTATMAVAIMVPFTFVMSPVTGLAVLAALYMAAIYGGCFSAILINTPGTPGSIATAFDGYPMANKGKGKKAIIGATIASVIGGIAGIIALLFFAPPLAHIALKFGPPEYFWLAIFGLTVMSSLGKGSMLKTFLAGLFGLLVSCIGVTIMGGEIRFGFGFYKLQAGIELISALIGLFCIPEALKLMSERMTTYTGSMGIKDSKEKLSSILFEIWNTRINILRSSLIGIFVGILPAAGGTIANIIAYNEAKKASKNPEKFGTGILEGVVAPEAANNATVGGGLIPTLTLGIPGTPVAAMIYGAILLQGLRPGAEFFEVHGEIAYSFIWALLISTIMMLFAGPLMGVETYKLISRVPARFLGPLILFLSIVGSYSIRNSSLDVVTMFIFGLLGYFFKELGLSPAAVVLGLILGPIAEQGLVQASLMSRAMGFYKVFFGRPISIIIIFLVIFSFLWPFTSAFLKKKRRQEKYAKQ